MIPPKRFDIFPPDWGMLRRSRCVQTFLQTAVRALSVPTLAAVHRQHLIRLRAVREPVLLLRQQSFPFPLEAFAASRSDYLEKDLTPVCYERDAAIVPALGPVLFMQNVYHGISPPLRYFPLVPHQLDHPVDLLEHGRVVVQPEFEEFD